MDLQWNRNIWFYGESIVTFQTRKCNTVDVRRDQPNVLPQRTGQADIGRVNVQRVVAASAFGHQTVHAALSVDGHVARGAKIDVS